MATGNAPQTHAAIQLKLMAQRGQCRVHRKTHMAAKVNKEVAAAKTAPATETVATENPVQAAFKRVSALLKQRSKLDAKRAEVAALEKQVAVLKEENATLEKQLKEAEKALRAEIPAAAVILDASAPKSDSTAGSGGRRGRKKSAKGEKLSSVQVDKVLARLTEPFAAGDFSAKAEELFPGLVNEPIKKIAAGKILQVPGTSRRGTRYTRIKG